MGSWLKRERLGYGKKMDWAGRSVPLSLVPNVRRPGTRGWGRRRSPHGAQSLGSRRPGGRGWDEGPLPGEGRKQWGPDPLLEAADLGLCPCTLCAEYVHPALAVWLGK